MLDTWSNLKVIKFWRWCHLYPVYTIKQTSSKHRASSSS